MAAKRLRILSIASNDKIRDHSVAKPTIDWRWSSDRNRVVIECKTNRNVAVHLARSIDELGTSIWSEFVAFACFISLDRWLGKRNGEQQSRSISRTSEKSRVSLACRVFSYFRCHDSCRFARIEALSTAAKPSSTQPRYFVLQQETRPV